MLGRVRASPMSSLEVLEMERHPSKIIKHDSLSIYEATLLKLKQGSRLYGMDEQCIMAIDAPEEVGMPNEAADSSSPDPIQSFSSATFHSTCSSEQDESRNMSILYFFSKCKSSTNKEPNTCHASLSSSSSSYCSSVLPTSSS